MANTKLVKVRYVGPHDVVQIAATGLEVKNGETVEVADWLAGRAPVGQPDADDYDPGAGLLAQPSNWQPGKPVDVKPSSEPKE